jgi:hypothetical protein
MEFGPSPDNSPYLAQYFYDGCCTGAVPTSESGRIAPRNLRSALHRPRIRGRNLSIADSDMGPRKKRYGRYGIRVSVVVQ